MDPSVARPPAPASCRIHLCPNPPVKCESRSAGRIRCGVPIITKDVSREQVSLLEFTERYSRQILFQPVGPEGQRRLVAARVAIVGCGATGSALSSLLARAGVGYLRIIDRDYVEPSNLQRQSLFDENDAAESFPKAIAAARKISAFNSEIVIEAR